MTDLSLPPPSYELSQQGHDQKIVGDFEKLQRLILSKVPVQDIEEERDEDDSKDSKESEKQQSFFQTPVQPLRIQKRTPHGVRPLPPSPADAQSRSNPAAISGPLKDAPEFQNYQVVLSPPPPLDGLPYEYSMRHASGSAASSSLSTSSSASSNPFPVRRGQQRPSSSYSPAKPHADSYRRNSHNPNSEYPSPSHPKNSSTFTRLTFDPSIAYGTSSNTTHDLWERPSDSTSNNATSLYSSAVSSYLHPASAVNPAPRSSYSGGRNRYSTSPSPRPSSSYETLVPGSGPVAPASQFHSPYIPTFSASHPSLSPSTRSSSRQGGHVRWATSEADFTRDIYP